MILVGIVRVYQAIIMVMMFENIQGIFLDITIAQWNVIERMIGLLTLVIIFWTAYETFRARQSNNKAIQISTIPVLLIDFRKKQEDYIAVVKNYRDIPVYDVKIEKWSMRLIDAQVVWSIDIKNKDFNLIEGNSEKDLVILFKENNKILIGSTHGVIMNSLFRSGLALSVEYKNFLGEKYYSIFRVSRDTDTKENIVELVKHPTRVNLYFHLYKFSNNLKQFINDRYYEMIWKFEKPKFSDQSYKYDLFSVIKRWWAEHKKRSS